LTGASLIPTLFERALDEALALFRWGRQLSAVDTARPRSTIARRSMRSSNTRTRLDTYAAERLISFSN